MRAFIQTVSGFWVGLNRPVAGVVLLVGAPFATAFRGRRGEVGAGGKPNSVFDPAAEKVFGLGAGVGAMQGFVPLDIEVLHFDKFQVGVVLEGGYGVQHQLFAVLEFVAGAAAGFVVGDFDTAVALVDQAVEFQPQPSVRATPVGDVPEAVEAHSSSTQTTLVG